MGMKRTSFTFADDMEDVDMKDDGMEDDGKEDDGKEDVGYFPFLAGRQRNHSSTASSSSSSSSLRDRKRARCIEQQFHKCLLFNTLYDNVLQLVLQNLMIGQVVALKRLCKKANQSFPKYISLMPGVRLPEEDFPICSGSWLLRVCEFVSHHCKNLRRVDIGRCTYFLDFYITSQIQERMNAIMSKNRNISDLRIMNFKSDRFPAINEKHFPLKKLTLSSTEHVQDPATIPQILQLSGSGLETLSLIDNVIPWRAISENCENLKTLRCERIEGLDGTCQPHKNLKSISLELSHLRSLKPLIRLTPNLTSLTIHDHTMDVSVQDLSKCCPNLSEIDFWRCDAQIMGELENLAGNLRSVKLTYPCDMDNIVSQLAEKGVVFPQLAVLELVNARISACTCTRFSQIAPNLKLLNLKGSQFGSKGTKNLASLKNLEYLGLESTKLCPEGFEFLALTDAFKNLKKVDIGQEYSMDFIKACSKIVSKCKPQWDFEWW